MILASATQQDLYRYSVENGSNQSFQEFSGYATLPDPVTGCGRKIPTSGSLLILEFSKDIQLTEDYYAPGSLNPGDNNGWKQSVSPYHAVCA